MNDVIDKLRCWFKDWRRGYSDADMVSALVKKYSDDKSTVCVLDKKEWKAFHTKRFDRLCFVIDEASNGNGTLMNLEDCFLYSAFKEALLKDPAKRECRKDKEFFEGSQWDDSPSMVRIKRPYEFNRITTNVPSISRKSVDEIMKGGAS